MKQASEQSVRRIAAVLVPSVGAPEPGEDEVAVEAPFELRHAGEVVAITMRTPGNDEELTAGFLLSEGLLHGEAAATTRRGTLMSAACGVCGRDGIEDLIERLRPVPPGPPFDAEVVASITRRLPSEQPIFARTGGTHAAALVTSQGEFWAVREDVGRHNAVDKAIGHAVLAGRIPVRDHLLAVSGRTSFEIVQKAIAAGIAAVVSVSAPSSLAIELAERFGVLLVGFARGASFKVYAGGHRLAPST